MAEKVINDYEVIDIALNPAYMTKDDLSNIKKTGLPVRWMEKDEYSDNNIFTITADEDD